MNKAWNIIKTVFVWLVVVAAVGMMIFTIVSVTTFDKNDRTLFGFRAMIVQTDSMSATDFNAGDLIFSKPVDPTTLQPGDIITFQSLNEESYGEIVTHKIREIVQNEEGRPAFVTYGTTTDTNDRSLVTYDFVLGKYAGRLPQVGTFFGFLKTTPGYIVCILLPFLILILMQGANCIKIFRQYRAEQVAEIEAEKAQIAEERAKSEEMMRELLELKKQLADQNAANAAEPPAEEQEPAKTAE
ncbi:MAG: signal peptidase I [Clostridia bacterium]|nr:signal peptidase I [Clostridia bacterium]